MCARGGGEITMASGSVTVSNGLFVRHLPPLESPPVTSSYVFYIVIIATPFLHHRRSLVEREERFRDYALSSNYQYYNFERPFHNFVQSLR